MYNSAKKYVFSVAPYFLVRHNKKISTSPPPPLSKYPRTKTLYEHPMRWSIQTEQSAASLARAFYSRPGAFVKNDGAVKALGRVVKVHFIISSITM